MLSPPFHLAFLDQLIEGAGRKFLIRSESAANVPPALIASIKIHQTVGFLDRHTVCVDRGLESIYLVQLGRLKKKSTHVWLALMFYNAHSSDHLTVVLILRHSIQVLAGHTLCAPSHPFGNRILQFSPMPLYSLIM